MMWEALPGLFTVRVTVSPGGCERIAAVRESPSGICWSSTLLMTVPAVMPALSATPPGVTAVMVAPVAAAAVGEAGLLLLTETPRFAWVDWPVVISSWTIRWAWSMGMAKPSPIDPGWVPAAC